MNIINRFVIGLTLVISVGIGLWMKSGLLLFLMTCIGVIYDMTFTLNDVLSRSKDGSLKPFTIPVFCTCNIIGAYLMLDLYGTHPEVIIMIIVLAPLSDIFQCIIGKTIGRHRIGWISPNKTWEGYIGGLVLLLCICFIYSVCDIILVYIVGIIGGLISSSVKRFINIKDFSKILGEHGGLLDRVDSIILPGVIYYTIYK